MDRSQKLINPLEAEGGWEKRSAMRPTTPFCLCPLKSQAPHLVRKTIRCGIEHLTRIKRALLQQEYENLQHFLQTGIDLGLYSANKQQAQRFYKRIKRDKEYPLSIRKDLLKIERKATKIATCWARIPIKGRRGGVWVAIKPHMAFPNEFEWCEFKLIRRKGQFFLHVTIQKIVMPKLPAHPSNLAIIACDIGEANPITSVAWWEGAIQAVGFHATELRAIRAHYTHLRKQIGRRKVKHALRVVKKIGNKEQRKVRDILHKATRQVIHKALDLWKQGFEPIIVIGDLKHHRPPQAKGNPPMPEDQSQAPHHAFLSDQIPIGIQGPVGRHSRPLCERGLHLPTVLPVWGQRCTN